MAVDAIVWTTILCQRQSYESVWLTGWLADCNRVIQSHSVRGKHGVCVCVFVCSIPFSSVDSQTDKQTEGHKSPSVVTCVTLADDLSHFFAEEATAAAVLALFQSRWKTLTFCIWKGILEASFSVSSLSLLFPSSSFSFHFLAIFSLYKRPIVADDYGAVYRQSAFSVYFRIVFL